MIVLKWMLRVTLAAFALGVLAALVTAFGLWLALAPTAGEWKTTAVIGIGRWVLPLEISVPRALRLATDARFARWLDGRRIESPFGPVALHWNAGDATLETRCAPCVVSAAALGPEPLRLAAARLALRRVGERRFEARLTSDAIVLNAIVTSDASSITLRGDLAPTPIAALYALLGDAVPEARQADIEGTIAVRATLTLPHGQWAIDPVVDGFAVSGLGTESLVNAKAPPQCARLPRSGLSPWLGRAVIAAEDQRFAEHPGYDLTELRHTVASNQRRQQPVRGASTITQQLAKLVYTGDERTLARKARELLYAVEMERTLGKARILRLYLALAPWGDGVCGAESAARHWFGKSASALDPLEAAWLAVRLRQPADAAPDTVTPERLVQVLSAMRGASRSQRDEWIERAHLDPPLLAVGGP